MKWTSQHLIDLSLPLSKETLVYPGDASPEIRRLSDVKSGDSLTASMFTLGCHIGTHIDAPGHFLSEGAMVDELPLESFCGQAIVIEQLGKHSIEKTDVENISIPTPCHIFFKTDNNTLLNKKTFSEDYCTLSPSAAEYLIRLHPLSIGWDYYSLDPMGDSNAFLAHKVFAQNNIPVFVCLNLKGVPEGRYGFSGFPLPLEGVEGAPVRAVLFREDLDESGAREG